LPRRKNNEAEFALYRDGFAFLAGISDLVRRWRTAPVSKIKRNGVLANLLITGSVAAGG
jgi:hypothetical protein